MKTSIETITPLYAKNLLSLNCNNRNVNRYRVSAYAEDMKNGCWQLTHQGILIGKNGNVIDGQHRLYAVIESGASIKTLVSVSDEIDSPLNCMVDTQMTRAQSFITGKSQMLIATANAAIESTKGNWFRTASLGTTEKNRVLSLIEPYFSDLMAGSKTTCKGITAASLIIGAIANMYSDDSNSDYVIQQFNAMRNAEFLNLSTMAGSFYRQVAIDRVAYTRKELVARSFRAFDYKRRNLSKLQVKDSDFAAEEAASAISKLIGY